MARQEEEVRGVACGTARPSVDGNAAAALGSRVSDGSMGGRGGGQKNRQTLEHEAVDAAVGGMTSSSVLEYKKIVPMLEV